ncbi:MAG TPA: SHOCT domain-containing protein [Acidimicrobiales bacterium]|nr:SHOCT domain-containing protein [Acidimicrobiales bacterium]
MFRYGHHAHHPVIAIIFLVLIAALVALAVIALVRMRRYPRGGLAASVGGMPPRNPFGPPPWAGGDPALNELRIRYARGDISGEEYWQRASLLGYPPSPGAGPAAPPPPGPTPPPAP